MTTNYSTHILSRHCLLHETVLLDMLEDEGSTNHVGSYQDNHSYLSEHEGHENLRNKIVISQ